MEMLMDQNWPEVASKTIDSLKSGITGATDALKQAAPQVWELLIRQIKIEGCELLFVGITLASLSVYSFKQILRLSSKAEAERARQRSLRYQGEAEPVTTVMLVLSWIGCIGGALISFICLSIAIEFLFNPGYEALNRILEHFGH